LHVSVFPWLLLLKLFTYLVVTVITFCFKIKRKINVFFASAKKSQAKGEIFSLLAFKGADDTPKAWPNPPRRLEPEQGGKDIVVLHLAEKMNLEKWNSSKLLFPFQYS
jgi:hypothetical protein